MPESCSDCCAGALEKDSGGSQEIMTGDALTIREDILNTRSASLACCDANQCECDGKLIQTVFRLPNNCLTGS